MIDYRVMKGKSMEFIRKNESNTLKVNQYKEMIYLTFPLLENTGLVRHLFSTRMGGASRGIYSSMNLSFSRGDNKEDVDENFRRIAQILDSTPEHIVCSKQTHTTNVRKVTEEDLGKGVVRETDYDDVDGLITNVPGIILATFYADCVPLYFVDVKKGAIGLSHSGWRGTVNRMGQVTLQAMKRAYGTEPSDVMAAIGPSICQDCYEVGEEVADAFRKSFPNEWEYLIRKGKEEGKYQLDLQETNRRILLAAGVLPENIAVTDICTCCNSELLFSHRGSNGKRGNLGAFLELRKS